MFIKGPLKDFAAPFSKKELQKLAKSSDLECRMISSDKSRKIWQVNYGPFRSEDLKPHSEGKATLLVQGVEKSFRTTQRIIVFYQIPSTLASRRYYG